MTYRYVIKFAMALLFNVFWLDLTAQEMAGDKFDYYWSLPRKQVFFDKMEKHWRGKWFLDGENAKLEHDCSGLVFSAGDIAGDDAHHAVLWTKKSFNGNLLIEYDYTRLDSSSLYVNIIYIQATGKGEGPFSKDIYRWRHLRRIPAMHMYFNTMNLYHISYAAGSTDPTIMEHYVRARRYMPSNGKGLQDTALTPDYHQVDVFKPNIKYHIKIIKYNTDLFMLVEGDQKSRLFSFNAAQFPLIESGRIGLRHMYTRSSKYENFKVSQINSR